MCNVLQKINDFLEEHNINNYPERKMLVAFSGGYDSMCLLYSLVKLNFNPIAIHLNHNWRGEESDIEEARCIEFCKKLGVNIYCEKLTLDIPKTETAARDARYKFFEKCSKNFDTNIVFTAHNANDNAETLLYRIVKGSGTDGLCGIAPVRGIFYRPLIKISREEIEEFCSKNSLIPNCDSSNYNTKYNRNYIRHNILPALRKINPFVIDAINSLSEISKEDCDFMNLCALGIGNSTKSFLSSHVAIQKRYVKNILTKYGIEYDRAKIEQILNFILSNAQSKSTVRYSLTTNLYLYINSLSIIVEHSSLKNYADSVNITKVGKYELGNKIFSIDSCCQLPNVFPLDKNKVAYIEIPEINFTLRTRRNGDIFYPMGLRGHQKLKKYLNEKKVPQYEKDKMLFLCKDNEVLWAPGLGLSDKIKVTNKPTHIIKLMERSENA